MARRLPILPLVLLVASALVVSPSAAQVGGPLQPPTTGGLPALLQELRMLGHNKRVLLIAAHPDDEDTELLVMLTRREGAEAAYLSLTRGEGGQNLIGNELGEALGILRTEELLAARNIDGAQQFFTRAYDFGFSKTLDDTWAHWPKDSVLKDVVRIIRRFRPQVVIGVFRGGPLDGHGQHQAAGWAAAEAYRIAGDPTRFPELQSEEGLAPWTPTKLYRSARFDPEGRTLVFEGGEVERVSGKTYHQLAMMGRSLHRSQDMGRLQEFGSSVGGLERIQPAGRDVGEGWSAFWSGVDTTLKAPPAHFTALAEARAAAGRDREGVSAALVRAQDALTEAANASDPAWNDYLGHLVAARGIVSWLFVDVIADRAVAVPGRPLGVEVVARNAGGRATEELSGRLDLRAGPLFWNALDGSVAPGATVRQRQEVRIPATATLTTPYYLRRPRVGDLYSWEVDPSLRGSPVDPPEIWAGLVRPTAHPARTGLSFEVGREGSSRISDQAIGEVRHPVMLRPRVGVALTPTIAVIRAGATANIRTVDFSVTLEHAAPDTTTGSVTLELPAGWARPSAQPFRLSGAGARQQFHFQVRAPSDVPAGEIAVRALATDGAGTRYLMGAFVVDYPHIRARQYTREARARIEAVELTTPSLRRVGYVRGAADRVPEALLAAGLDITILDSMALESGDLRAFDAIVIGPRAYEIDSALVRNNDRLLDYARDGGRVVVQYQQQVFLEGSFTPYRLGGNSRITDERSPVTMLGATPSQSALAPVFRTPNAIGPEDWEGWVQDRALYCPTTWAPEFHPLLAMNDPGEAPIRGCLLESTVGRGSYVYTGLAFFRELPGGVPGAYRLFFNLLGGRATP